MAALTSPMSFGSASDRPSEALLGLSVAEAREARDYWRRREAQLPWHRRAARAEAREMALRWRQRLLTARLERWGLAHSDLIAPVVAWLSLPRRDQTRRLASILLRTRIVKRMVVMAAALAVTSVAALVLVVALAGQVL